MHILWITHSHNVKNGLGDASRDWVRVGIGLSRCTLLGAIPALLGLWITCGYVYKSVDNPVDSPDHSKILKSLHLTRLLFCGIARARTHALSQGYKLLHLTHARYKSMPYSGGLLFKNSNRMVL